MRTGDEIRTEALLAAMDAADAEAVILPASAISHEAVSYTHLDVYKRQPFNLSGWGADKLVDDVRWQYGTPPAGNANFAWLQHMIWHLAPNGRIGICLLYTSRCV